MDSIELKEATEFFDQFVNAALSQEVEGYTALEVVQNYNVVKQELAKLLVNKD